jgi:hypothetical protein
MVSADAVPAQQAIAAIATSRNRYRDRCINVLGGVIEVKFMFGVMSGVELRMVRFLQAVPRLVCICRRDCSRANARRAWQSGDPQRG